jgi:hypothetical protein
MIRLLSAAVFCLLLPGAAGAQQDGPVPVATVKEFAEAKASALALGALGLKSFLMTREETLQKKLGNPNVTVVKQGARLEVFAEHADNSPKGKEQERCAAIVNLLRKMIGVNPATGEKEDLVGVTVLIRAGLGRPGINTADETSKLLKLMDELASVIDVHAAVPRDGPNPNDLFCEGPLIGKNVTFK